MFDLLPVPLMMCGHVLLLLQLSWGHSLVPYTKWPEMLAQLLVHSV